MQSVRISQQEVGAKILDEHRTATGAKQACDGDCCDDCGSCAYCHLTLAAAVPTDSVDLAFPLGLFHMEIAPVFFSSHIPSGPRRPDRTLVA
jgi:hypothetical protein